MKKSRRIANRLARRRLKARRSEYRRIAAYAAALGVEILPWQLEQLVRAFAGPDPRRERMRRSYDAHPAGRMSGKSITLTLYDELRKDTTA